MPVSSTMGRGDRASTSGIRHAFAAPYQGIHHLQGDRKPASHPDPAWPTKIENTVRYLGVDVEDALELAELTEV